MKTPNQITYTNTITATGAELVAPVRALEAAPGTGSLAVGTVGRVEWSPATEAVLEANAALAAGVRQGPDAFAQTSEDYGNQLRAATLYNAAL
jgi:hypothetical protein